MNLSGLKHEIQVIGWVTLYFFFWFGVMLTLKKLFLSDYQIEVKVLSTAAIGAVVVAKVVVVLDQTKAGTRFDAKFPLGLAALYKTLLYTLATFMVLFAERLFEAYREAGALQRAMDALWEHRDLHLLLAKVICLGLAFFAYHLYAGLDRKLGEGTLRRLVTLKPEIGK